MDRDVNVMAANFEAAYAGREKARALFRVATTFGPGLNSGDTYAPTADGQRFLVVERPSETPPFHYTVLLNWRRALEQP